MKRLLPALIVVAVLLCATPSHSGEEDKDFNVTIAPLGLIIGGLKATFSYAPASFLSIDLSPVYVAPLILPAHAVGGELRLTYWWTKPYNGFFFGPWLQVSRTYPADSLLLDYGDVKVLGATAVAPGAYLGYRWLWESGFNIGFGGGLGYAFAVEKDDFVCPSGHSCDTTTSGEGVTGFILFDLGYAF